jgi:hypothetical protein
MDPELQAELIVEHGLDNLAIMGGKEAQTFIGDEKMNAMIRLVTRLQSEGKEVLQSKYELL